MCEGERERCNSYPVPYVLFILCMFSSWSRWLFALLSEGPDQEIVSLDVFSPQEFGSVLDYMYGEPLEFTLAVSCCDGMLFIYISSMLNLPVFVVILER